MKEMQSILLESQSSADWEAHFNGIRSGLKMATKEAISNVVEEVSKWQRERLQTRFFETGELSSLCCI